MGYKDAPVCVGCLARELGHDRARFLDHVKAHLDRRDCYRAGWLRAGDREGSADPERPECLWR